MLRRLIGVALVLGYIAPQPALTQDSKSVDSTDDIEAALRWYVTHGRDEIDDSLLASASTHDESGSNLANLKLHCGGGRTSFLVEFEQPYLPGRDNRVQVAYRLDSEAAETGRWLTLDQHIAIIGEEAVFFIRQLYGHDRIYFRITDRLNRQYSAGFILDGVGHAISAVAEACDWLSPMQYREIQAFLAQRGFYEGGIDGHWDWGSRRALREYKVSEGLPRTTELDGETLALIREQMAEENASLEDGVEPAER